MNDLVGQMGEIFRRKLNLPCLGEGPRWRITLDGYPALVELEEGWICGKMALRLQKRREWEAFDWLEASSDIRGPARFAVVEGGLRLQGEVPLEEEEAEEGLYRGLRELIAAFKGGREVFEGRVAGRDSPPPGAPRSSPHEGDRSTARPVAPEEWLEESGQSWERREGGEWATRLAGEGFSREVRAIPDGEGIRFQVELAGYGTPEEETRRALGHLLMEANRRLRFARTAIQAGGKGRIVAEVALGGRVPLAVGCQASPGGPGGGLQTPGPGVRGPPESGRGPGVPAGPWDRQAKEGRRMRDVQRV